MNVGDIKIQVKRIFGDESEVQLTNADIVRWINDAMINFVMNNEGVLEATALANSTQGVQEYTLPVDLLVLDSVSYKRSDDASYFTLQGRSLKEFDLFIDGWDGTLYGTGRPTTFHKYANKIRLFPIPEETTTDAIKIYYRRYPAVVANDADVPELPLEYHNAIVQFVLQRAYFMDEDYEASQLAEAKVVNDLNTASERENWRQQAFYPTITVLPEDSEMYY